MIYRDEQCPKRAPGLTHTQDGSIICVHCSQMVFARGLDGLETGIVTESEMTELHFEPRGPQGRNDSPGRGAFTRKQEADLEFLAWLYWQGRLD